MTEKEKRKKSDEIEIPVKWLFVTLVIIVAVVLFFVFGGFKGISFGGVSESQAEQILLDFFESEIPTSQIEIIDSSNQGDFYEFIVSLDGEQVPLYVTKDGNFMTIDLIPIR
ncbi:MAG: hypothetical protein WDZ69_00805 [Candidatus Pacearchaeota archaeon]